MKHFYLHPNRYCIRNYQLTYHSTSFKELIIKEPHDRFTCKIYMALMKSDRPKRHSRITHEKDKIKAVYIRKFSIKF